MSINLEDKAKVRVARPSWNELKNTSRTDELMRRQETFNVGESRVPFEMAWWQNICKHLLERIEALESVLGGGSEVATTDDPIANAVELIKRGPGRPPKVA